MLGSDVPWRRAEGKRTSLVSVSKKKKKKKDQLGEGKPLPPHRVATCTKSVSRVGLMSHRSSDVLIVGDHSLLLLACSTVTQ